MRAATVLALIAAVASPALVRAAPVGAVVTASDATASRLTPQVLFEFLLAEIAGARGQLDVSVQAYLDLARRTRDPRIARRATEIALFARQIEAAGEAARLWNDLEPESAEAQRILAGIIAGGSGRFEDAQAKLARILAESGDKLGQNLLGLNRAFAQVSDKQLVRAAVFRLTEPYLEFAEAHFARAHAAYGADEADTALAELGRVLELKADWEPAILLKVQLLQADDAPAAIAVLQDYLGRHEQSVPARSALARILVGQKRYEEAREQFRTLLKGAPDDAETLNAVAILSLELEDYAEAERLFKRLLETGARDQDAVRLHLGQVAQRLKHYDEALKWYREIPHGAASAEARVRIAQTLAESGRLDEAVTYLRSLPGDAKATKGFRLLEAQLLRDAGRFQQAYDVVDEALRASPEDADLLYESAMLAEKLGKLEVMEGRLRKLIALKPDYSHAYNALGYSLVDRGVRLDESEDLIRKALELAPEDPFILDSMGWVRFKRGDADDARQYLERAYGLRPDPEIAAHLGEVYWGLGLQDKARKLWSDARAEHPDNAVLKGVLERFGL
jgi:tetratricopeptide (TPR) repeat protein